MKLTIEDNVNIVLFNINRIIVVLKQLKAETEKQSAEDINRIIVVIETHFLLFFLSVCILLFKVAYLDKLWYCINEIGFLAGIKGNLNHHQSRHSFGTHLLSAGIPIEISTKMMGHSNISTTQVYAKVTDDKISEDMDQLIERRKTMNSKNRQSQ